MTTADKFFRGLLYVIVAVCAYLTGSDAFREIVPPTYLVFIGTVGAAALAVRAFIDGSVNQKPEGEVQAVEVVNTPENAIPVERPSDVKDETQGDEAAPDEGEPVAEIAEPVVLKKAARQKTA